MILDTSAIIAMLLNEPGSELLKAAIRGRDDLHVGSPTVLEAGMVISSRLRKDGRPLIGDMLRQLNITIIPFDDSHAWAATGAFIRFGKGRHPAGLNFGDCMSYAIATIRQMPLLYTGNDFGKTDVISAL